MDKLLKVIKRSKSYKLKEHTGDRMADHAYWHRKVGPMVFLKHPDLAIKFIMNDDSWALDCLRYDGHLIRKVRPEFRTSFMIETALKSNPSAIKHLYYQSHENVELAIKKWPFVLKFLENKTDEIQLLALSYVKGRQEVEDLYREFSYHHSRLSRIWAYSRGVHNRSIIVSDDEFNKAWSKNYLGFEDLDLISGVNYGTVFRS